MPAISATLTCMIKAAEKAARGLKRDFGEVENLQVSKKGPGDFVSIADKKSEETIQKELMKARPDFGFFGEETGETGSDKPDRFIVDPLDGTSNFLRAIPHWNISIAHERKGEIISAVVYDPIKDEMFYADKGNGAYLNSRRLRVTPQKKLEDAMAIIGCGKPVPENVKSWSEIANNLGQKGCRIRSFASGALDICYVAAGRADIHFEIGLAPWDFAAARLIVTEAGGMATRADGSKLVQEQGSFLATNGLLHKLAVEIINGGSPTASKARKAG